MVSGAGLQSYSVVVGSFSVIANAEGLQQRLKNAGYAAQIVKNEERNMYRVVASTYNNKADAVASRDQLRSTYADAWLRTVNLSPWHASYPSTMAGSVPAWQSPTLYSLLPEDWRLSPRQSYTIGSSNTPSVSPWSASSSASPDR